MYIWARGELGPSLRRLVSRRLVAVSWRRRLPRTVIAFHQVPYQCSFYSPVFRISGRAMRACMDRGKRGLGSAGGGAGRAVWAVWSVVGRVRVHGGGVLPQSSLL